MKKLILKFSICLFTMNMSMISRDEFSYINEKINIPNFENIFKESTLQVEEEFFLGYKKSSLINKVFYSNSITPSLHRGCINIQNGSLNINKTGMKQIKISIYEEKSQIMMKFEQLSTIVSPGTVIKNSSLNRQDSSLTSNLLLTSKLQLIGVLEEYKEMRNFSSSSSSTTTTTEKNTIITSKDILNNKKIPLKLLNFNIAKYTLTENGKFTLGSYQIHNDFDILRIDPNVMVIDIDINANDTLIFRKDTFDGVIYNNLDIVNEKTKEGSSLYFAIRYKNGQWVLRFPSIYAFENIDARIQRPTVLIPIFQGFKFTSSMQKELAAFKAKFGENNNFFSTNMISTMQSKIQEELNAFKFEKQELISKPKDYFNELFSNSTPFFAERLIEEDLPPVVYIDGLDPSMCDTDFHFIELDAIANQAEKNLNPTNTNATNDSTNNTLKVTN